MSVALNKVEAPDVIGFLRPEPNARAVVEPQASPWLVLLGNLKPLATPDALDPVPPNSPSDPLQQGGDPPVAIAAILRGERDDGLGERILVSPEGGHITLCSPGLADEAAGVALREAVLLPDAADRLPASLGAELSFPARCP